MSSQLDHLLQRLKRQEARKPTDAVARFIVTKLSWRGNYKRVLSITPSAIVTQYVDTLAVTNSWAYAGDHDLAGVEVGGEHAEGGIFTLHFRRDKKGISSKDAKFACKDRAALLTVLYQSISVAAGRGLSGLGTTVLGTPDSFSGHKLKKGKWVPAVLRVTAFAIERLDPATGAVRWRLEFRHMASPAARLLASAGAGELAGAPAPAGQAPFALFGKTGRSPRVYCCRDRDGLLRQMQASALKKVGVTLAVDTNAQIAGQQLLSMVASAERERAAGHGEAPLGEWEVTRVCDVDTTTATDLAASKLEGAGGASVGVRGVVQRRLVLTQSGLLERRVASYEVAEWRQLAAVAAVVRYSEDPQWLAVEWTDGAPLAVYLTPAREALLVALLDAAQAASGRPVPVLVQPTGAGEVVVAHRSQAVGAPVAELDLELEKMCLGHLASAAKDFMANGGGAASLAALAHAGLTGGSGSLGGHLLLEGSGALAPTGSHSEGGSEDGAEGPQPGPLDFGSPQTSGRTGFMRRAFARPANDGRAAPLAAAAVAGGSGGGEGAAALFQQRMRELLANVPLSGVSPGCKVEDAVIAALLAHLPRQQQHQAADKVLGLEEGRVVVIALQCLQRAASSLGAAATIVGPAGGAGRIFASLQSGNSHVAFEAARLLTRLFAPAAARVGAGPWQMTRGGLGDADPMALNTSDESAAARSAKSVCFISNTRCTAMASVLKGGGGPAQSPLVTLGVAEALAALVCEPGCRTTDPHTLSLLIQEVAGLGHPLFALFNHPAPRVADAAALMMRAIAEGGAAAAEPMRAAALAEGAILHHLSCALGPQGPRAKLSQELVAVWADEYAPALALLRRIFPPGLMRYLNAARPRPPNPPKPSGGFSGGSSGGSLGSGSLQGHASSSPRHLHALAPLSAQQAGSAATAQQALAQPPAQPAPTAALPASLPQTQQVQQAQQAAKQQAAQQAQQAPNPLQAPVQQQVASAHAVTAVAAAQQGGAAPALPAAAVPTAGSEDAESRGPPSPLARRFFSSPADKQPVSLRCNWEAFWGAVAKDHSHAGLIWNERTRSELREAVQTEEGLLRMGRMRAADGAGTPPPCWNHTDFRVSYPSLSRQLCVGGTYVKLLLDGTDSAAVEKLASPREFFLAAYHHFLCLGDPCLYPPGLEAAAAAAAPSGSSSAGSSALGESSDPAADRELCVRAMAATYAVHAAAVGPFEGVGAVLRLLDATPSRPLRHCLLRLLEALVGGSRQSGQSRAGVQGGEKLPAVAGGAAGGGSTIAAGGVDSSSAAAAAAFKANAAAIVGAGGVELLVDLLTTAHEASERPVAALQSNLIAAGSFAEEKKEWYYYPPLPQEAKDEGGQGSDPERGREGPVSKEEVRQLVARGAIDASTPVWVVGMPQPQPLAAVRELRWWVARGLGPLTPFQVAGTALRVLLALARLHPAADPERGTSLYPLPLAHRQMASQRCLPHIAQLLLTNEPSLVDGTCELLVEVLAHNPDALAGLYRTGAPFFLLAYCGSNLTQAAGLLKISHLKQHFRGAGEAPAGQPLAQRSFLGGLLPESLLYQLESYGPEAFAAALAGDSDTPELIWTHRMRGQRLVPQMLAHLGDFPRRLSQHATALYEYTPCPPVGYPELSGELWCRRYYLRHLCDEDTFPGWTLVDHVPFLQALLDEWRAELARKPLSMSEAEACRVLGITAGEGGGAVSEEDLKAAYRRQARLYHPDKNPQGRDKFVAVHKAYERLQAGATGGQGPQPWRVLLLLKAQCILFRRYPSVLQPFKYAGYPLLLQAITLPAPEGSGGSAFTAADAAGAQQQQQQQQHFLSAEAAPRLTAAVQLCWLTCACSTLNGEELTRSGGVGLLGDLLSRCVAVLPLDVAPNQPAAVIATHSLRALAVMAAFESARAELAQRAQLVADSVWCCGLQRAAAAVDAALLALVQMCQSATLQALLLRSGVLGWVVPLLLAFDTTHGEDGGAGGEGGGLPPALDIGQAGRSVPDFLGLGVERPNMQAARNLHAMLAVRALAALAGYPGARPPTPANQEAQAALRTLLTETLAPRLAEPDPLPLLRDLNTTVQTPQVIWNNRMREELLELMASQRAAPSAPQPTTPQAFSYTSLRGELVVAGVFVRVYNQQPAFSLSDPAALCKGLVTFLHSAHQRQKAGAGAAGGAGGGAGGGAKGAGGDSEAAEQQAQQAAQQAQHLLQALAALRHVLEAAPRLLGLLSTRQALEPLLDCIQPACSLGHCGPLWPTAPVLTGQQQTGQAAGAAAAGGGPEAAGAVEGAELALQVLLRLTAHAGCIDVMAQERCVVQAYWLVDRPPTPTALMLSLRLLHALAGTPAAAWSAAAHAGTLYLLSLLLPAAPVADETDRGVLETGRAAAASLLGRLLSQPLHGPRVGLLLGKILPPGLVALIQDGPGEAVVAALGQSSETPERLWNRSLYQATAEEVAHLAAAARAAQAGGTLDWSLPEDYQLPGTQQLEGGARELFMGGVYVRLFLKNPQYPLRNPKAFLEALLERYLAILQAATPTVAAIGSPLRPSRPRSMGAAPAAGSPPGHASPPVQPASGAAASAADADLAVLLSAAAVAVLQNHAPLADHVVALGYVEKLLKLLAARLPPLPAGGLAAAQLDAVPAALADDVTGSILRLLHQLSASLAAAEALARCSPPAVPTLAVTLLCGTAAAVLGLETLKRALAPANRSRDLLVGACLGAGLPQVLLQRLDWRGKERSGGEGEEDRDEAVQRVLFVDLLNLLAEEGAYAERMRVLLDHSDVWHAYRHQRHDLFLPAGGNLGAGVVGLLKGPEMARFALPPAPTASDDHTPKAEQQETVSAAPPLAAAAAPAATVAPAPAPAPPATMLAPLPAATPAASAAVLASVPAPAPVPAIVPPQPPKPVEGALPAPAAVEPARPAAVMEAQPASPAQGAEAVSSDTPAAPAAAASESSVVEAASSSGSPVQQQQQAATAQSSLTAPPSQPALPAAAAAAAAAAPEPAAAQPAASQPALVLPSPHGAQAQSAPSPPEAAGSTAAVPLGSAGSATSSSGQQQQTPGAATHPPASSASGSAGHREQPSGAARAPEGAATLATVSSPLEPAAPTVVTSPQESAAASLAAAGSGSSRLGAVGVPASPGERSTSAGGVSSPLGPVGVMTSPRERRASAGGGDVHPLGVGVTSLTAAPPGSFKPPL